MARKCIVVLFVSVFLVLSAACSLPYTISQIEASRSPTTGINATDIAQTVIAEISARTATATTTPSVTMTSEPTQPVWTQTPPPPQDTQTSIPEATLTEGPCNKAAFLTDVTITDGTEIQTGTGFTKTWRLQNTGSCTWTSGYHVTFVSGDRMNAPDGVVVTNGTVPSGATVDVSVFLTAPITAGTYRGNFKLQDQAGSLFGVGSGGPFYVEIAAVDPDEPPDEAAKSDLIIQKITLDPETPGKGDPVTVTVQTWNAGDKASGPYTVKWWAGENYAAPACSWNVENSNPNGGRVLSCVYAGYPSSYGNIYTKASIDTGGTVDESDEDNNTLRKQIQVDN